MKYLAKGSVPNDRCDSLFEPAAQIFDYLEWIAKVTSHIPEKGAQLLHYYGAYSNSHRGKRAKSAASAIASNGNWDKEGRDHLAYSSNRSANSSHGKHWLRKVQAKRLSDRQAHALLEASDFAAFLFLLLQPLRP